MSILATELDWPEGTKFFEVRCRLGIWDVDGWDLDKEPEVKTLGGTVRITPRTPTGRIRILEPDGKYRVVVTPPLTFAIDEFTGRLVNTADNTEGVWVVDPASDTVDPKDFTYSAVVTPKVGSPFTVEFDGSVAINGVYDLANGTTVAPSRGVSVLEARITKLEQEGGLPHGDIPIFATLDEAMAYESENPGSLALTIESTEPDTTPPTAGTLSVSQLGGTYLEVKVSGASDDRGGVEYEFSLDGVAQPWQAEDRYMWTGLALESAHTVTYRVRDRAGNLRSGMSLPVTTLAADPEPQWGTRWHDDFDGDGLLEGRSMDSGSGTWTGRQLSGDALWSTSGGLVKYVQAEERGVLSGGYAAAAGLRGIVATVPVQASSRVRITLVGNRSSVWATLGPFMQSAAGDRWLVGMASAQTGTGRIWSLAAGSTWASELEALPDLGAPTSTATYVYDFTPGNLAISIDGKEVASIPTVFDLTAPAHWGFYYGRNSNNGVSGSVDSFTIRWE